MLRPLLGPACLGTVTSIGWSVGEALLIPFLLKHGVSASLASLVWVVNPSVGLFVNAGELRNLTLLASNACSPLPPPWRLAGCGVMMDRSTSMLVFVLGLQVMSVVGLVMLALAQLVEGNPAALLGLVLVGYGAADLAHDVMGAPTQAIMLAKVRAISSPATAKEVQSKGHALVSFMLDVGRIAGLGFAAIPWEGAWPGATQLQGCIVAAVVANTVLVAIACATSGQSWACSWKRSGAATASTCQEALWEEVGPLFALPRRAQWVMCLTFLGWLLHNSLSFYWTAWVSTAVFPGGGTVSVQWGAAGMAVTALASMGWGVALPAVNAWVGRRSMLVLAVVVGAAVAIGTAVGPLQSLWGSLVLAALLGLLPAALCTNAFPLLQIGVGQSPLAEQHATLAGLTNTCMVLSQLLGTGAAVGILSIAKHTSIPCTWHLASLAGQDTDASACEGVTSVAFLLALYGGLVALGVLALCTVCVCPPSPPSSAPPAQRPEHMPLLDATGGGAAKLPLQPPAQSVNPV